MTTVALYTLGCKVNQVESGKMAADFAARGFQVVDPSEPADICVVNTCTVTHVSDRKSRALLRRLRRRHPQAVVVATGCLATVGQASLREMAEVDMVVPNADKERLAELVAGRLGIASRAAPAARPAGRTRGFVKVQDGCESHCAYCIVPLARGRVRSAPPLEVVEEVRALVGAGCREVVLTGIHIGTYGADLPGWDLVRLLELLLERVQGDYRLRLGSLEPLEVGEGVVGLMSADARLCRHLHIPLQSGSDRVLRRMNRRYDRAFYRGLVEGLACSIPGIAVTADVMVGFPGETERDFADTFELLRALPLLDLHVFRFSPRPGTAAAEWGDLPGPAECARRSRQLLELAADKKADFIRASVGGVERVLVEERVGERWEGLTDTYVRVVLDDDGLEAGQLVTVRIVGAAQEAAQGKVVCRDGWSAGG